MAQEAQDTARHCLLRRRVEKILLSLQFETISTRKSDIPQAHKETFRWSLSEEKASLATWLRSGHGSYWIEGKAGSGKSTLMKYLQKEFLTRELLLEWAHDRALLVLSHFFWAQGTDLQRNLTGLFRTLLFYIFMQDPELLEETCPSRMQRQEFHHLEPWTLEELKECFEYLSARKTLPSKLCIFIDGLDEFQGDHDHLIEIIRVTAECKDMKLCVSSRPWVQFRQAFGHLPWKLRVEDLTKQDISRYIQDNLLQNAHYANLQRRFPGEAESLTEELVDAADGIFLWVYLATREILRGLTNYDDISTLQRRLRDIPRDLEDYFKRMLLTIDRVYYFETSALFTILAYCQSSVDTLLTWAYRRSLPVSQLLYRDGIPLGSEAVVPYLPPEWLQLRSKGLLTSPRRDRVKQVELDYDPEGEKNKVIARCKDLVHVSEGLERTGAGAKAFKVGFFHRTVADFLALPGTRRIIDARLEEQGFPFIAPAALGYAYLELLQLEMSLAEQNRVHQYHRLRPRLNMNHLCLWAIYYAKQARPHSAQASSYIALLLRSLAANNCGVVGAPFPESWGGSPAEYGKFFRLLSCLGLGILETSVLCQHDPSSAHPKPVGPCWMLNCRECLSRSHEADLLDMLEICVQRKLDVVLGDDGEVKAKQMDEADLENIKTLVSLLREFNTTGEMDRVWCRCLFALWSPREPDHEPPSNSHDICRMLIQLGAPRYVSAEGMDKLYHLKPDMWTEAMGRSAVFDTVMVLNDILNLQDYNMEQEFAQAAYLRRQTRDSDSLSVGRGGWWGWRPWGRSSNC